MGGGAVVSAASIAAMVACLEEDRRRRMDPDYTPLLSVGTLMDVPWAMPLICFVMLVWSAAMIWMVVS